MPLDLTKEPESPNRDLLDHDFEILGDMRAIQISLTSLRSTVNRYLSPDRYKSGEKTPDDPLRELSKELQLKISETVQLKKQIRELEGKLERAEKQQQKLVEKGDTQFDTFVEYAAAQGARRHGKKLLVAAFRAWFEHCLDTFFLRQQAKLDGELAQRQSARKNQLARIVQMWRGNRAEMLMTESMNAWRTFTHDGTVKALRARVEDLEEQLSQLGVEVEDRAVTPEARARTPVADNSALLQELSEGAHARAQLEAENARLRERILALETDQASGAAAMERMLHRMRTMEEEARASSAGTRPNTAKEVKDASVWTDEIVAAPGLHGGLPDSRATSRQRTAQSSRHGEFGISQAAHEAEIDALRLAFEREVQALRQRLELEKQQLAEAWAAEREELVSRASRVNSAGKDGLIEYVRIEEDVGNLQAALDSARNEMRLTIAVYVNAEREWNAKFQRLRTWIEQHLKQFYELQKVVETYERMTAVGEPTSPSTREVPGRMQIVPVRSPVRALSPAPSDPSVAGGLDSGLDSRLTRSSGFLPHLGAATTTGFFPKNPKPIKNAQGVVHRFQVRRVPGAPRAGAWGSSSFRTTT